MPPLFLLKRHRMVLRLFCALVLIGCGYHARGQYHSFFADSITEYSVCGGYVGYQNDSKPFSFYCNSYDFRLMNSDTVSFHGKNYFAIRNPSHESIYGLHYIYLREDTLSGQIYRYDEEFDREVLTCDMSLSLGDTFWLPYSMSYYGSNPQHGTNTTPVPIIADSVWFLNGLKYIRFARVEEPWESYLYGNGIDIMFIEGIGPNYSPFGWCDGYMECPGSCYISGIYNNYLASEPLLLCVYKNGEQVYMTDERAGCYQVLVNVKEEEVISWRLYPNPAKNHLTIKIDHEISDGFLWITDLYGRVMYTQPIRENTFKLNLGQYSAGTYIVTISSDNKLFSKKIIKR